MILSAFRHLEDEADPMSFFLLRSLRIPLGCLANNAASLSADIALVLEAVGALSNCGKPPKFNSSLWERWSWTGAWLVRTLACGSSP